MCQGGWARQPSRGDDLLATGQADDLQAAPLQARSSTTFPPVGVEVHLPKADPRVPEDDSIRRQVDRHG